LKDFAFERAEKHLFLMLISVIYVLTILECPLFYLMENAQSVDARVRSIIFEGEEWVIKYIYTTPKNCFINKELKDDPDYSESGDYYWAFTHFPKRSRRRW